MSFFQPGSASDLDYAPLRDLPQCEPHRRFVEELWAQYRPSEDRHFLSDAKANMR